MNSYSVQQCFVFLMWFTSGGFLFATDSGDLKGLIFSAAFMLMGVWAYPAKETVEEEDD